MFNDNDCFGNIRIKIRPNGKYLCLSFEFHKAPAPRSFCIKYVIKRRERRVRAITSARLKETDTWLWGLLAGSLGAQSHPICQAAVAPLCGGWRWQRPSPAAAQVTGRLCSPVPCKEHGHSRGVGSGGAQHHVPALTNAHPALWAWHRAQPFASASARNLGMPAWRSNTAPFQVPLAFGESSPGSPCLDIQICHWIIIIFAKIVFLGTDKIGNLEVYLASLSRLSEIFPEKYQKHAFTAFLLS